jgi:hypothetical protein
MLSRVALTVVMLLSAANAVPASETTARSHSMPLPCTRQVARHVTA